MRSSKTRTWRRQRVPMILANISKPHALVYSNETSLSISIFPLAPCCCPNFPITWMSAGRARVASSDESQR